MVARRSPGEARRLGGARAGCRPSFGEEPHELCDLERFQLRNASDQRATQRSARAWCGEALELLLYLVR